MAEDRELQRVCALTAESLYMTFAELLKVCKRDTPVYVKDYPT